MDAAGVREKSGWFAAGAVALDGPIAAAFWSFLCVIVWRFRSCVEWCVQATDVSERSRNGSAYLGWLMPCVSHATGCGAGRVYHRPESKIKALLKPTKLLHSHLYLRHLQSYTGRAAPSTGRRLLDATRR